MFINDIWLATMPLVNKNISEQTDVREHLEKRQLATKERYDKHARPKEDLALNQQVRVYNKDTRRWDPAIVTGFADTPRSFIVQRGGGALPLRRNRQHLKRSSEEWQDGLPPADPMEDFEPCMDDAPVVAAVPDPTPSTFVEASGTIPSTAVKEPASMGHRYPLRSNKPNTVIEAPGTIPSTSVEEPASMGHRYPRREHKKPTRYR